MHAWPNDNYDDGDDDDEASKNTVYKIGKENSNRNMF